MRWQDHTPPNEISEMLEDLYLRPMDPNNTSITRWKDGSYTLYHGFEMQKHMTEEEYRWMKEHPEEIGMESLL